MRPRLGTQAMNPLSRRTSANEEQNFVNGVTRTHPRRAVINRNIIDDFLMK